MARGPQRLRAPVLSPGSLKFWLGENCLLPGLCPLNISVHIFAPNGGCSLYNKSSSYRYLRLLLKLEMSSLSEGRLFANNRDIVLPLSGARYSLLVMGTVFEDGC